MNSMLKQCQNFFFSENTVNHGGIPSNAASVHTESTKQSAEEIAGSYKTLHFISNALFLVLLSGGYLIFIGDTPNVHYKASVKELESICDDSNQQFVEETRGKL